MEEKPIINYGKAKFSVVKIELDTYIATLTSIDETLKEEKNLVNLLTCRDERTEIFAKCLNEYALQKFCETKKYIEQVQRYKEGLSNIEVLQEYLDQNPESLKEYNSKITELESLIHEKSQVIKEFIQKCFEYVSAVHNIDTID